MPASFRLLHLPPKLRLPREEEEKPLEERDELDVAYRLPR
jgi:hypothetical protein